MRSLQQVALLVQGCWVVKSEVSLEKKIQIKNGYILQLSTLIRLESLKHCETVVL